MEDNEKYTAKVIGNTLRVVTTDEYGEEDTVQLHRNIPLSLSGTLKCTYYEDVKGEAFYTGFKKQSDGLYTGLVLPINSNAPVRIMTTTGLFLEFIGYLGTKEIEGFKDSVDLSLKSQAIFEETDNQSVERYKFAYSLNGTAVALGIGQNTEIELEADIERLIEGSIVVAPRLNIDYRDMEQNYGEYSRDYVDKYGYSYPIPITQPEEIKLKIKSSLKSVNKGYLRGFIGIQTQLDIEFETGTSVSFDNLRELTSNNLEVKGIDLVMDLEGWYSSRQFLTYRLTNPLLLSNIRCICRNSNGKMVDLLSACKGTYRSMIEAGTLTFEQLRAILNIAYGLTED